jgi:hypothetical protein
MPITSFQREVQEERKAKTDVLVPLTTTLVAVILERKKAAQRFVEWFRSQVASIEHGELQLPAEVEYRGHELGIDHDAASVEDVHWVRREVRLRSTLWDPRTYVQNHRDRAWLADRIYPGMPKKARAHGIRSYTPMKNHHPASGMIICVHLDGVDERSGDTGNRLVEDLQHP